MSIIKKVKWHFRDNFNRKNGKKKKHPSLIFAKTSDGSKYYNIGLTHEDRRGHHKNIEISDPCNWKKKSYLRNDISADDIELFGKILNNYKVNPKDKDKISKLILKFKLKNKIK